MGFIITQTKKENEEHHNHKEEKEEEQSLNIKAVYLETLSDTIGAAGVLVAGLIIHSPTFIWQTQ